MYRKNFFPRIVFALLTAAVLLLPTAVSVHAEIGSAAELIASVNAIRSGYGNTPLVEDAILDSTALATAQTMAASKVCAHIGDASGRVAAAGYGSGAKVWATENIACGMMSVSELMSNYWADASHLLPMTDANYKNIGAGVAIADGWAYYVVHAAFTSGGASSGKSQALATLPPAAATQSNIINSVVTVTPQTNGSLVHIVQQGQALWSIAIAYGITVNQIVTLNGLNANTPMIYAGQKLTIRPAFTPTLSPTITPTQPPATYTPKPTRTPRLPTLTSTPLPTATSTPRPLIPGLNMPNKQVLGIGIIVACGLGLLAVLLSTLLGKK